jgi:hypothetical protein
MKLTDDKLKQLYQQQTARSARRQAECLSDETLLRAAAGELGQTERERMADHLMVCSDCATEYRLVQSLKPWAERVVATSGEPVAEAEMIEQHSGWAASVRAFWEQLLYASKWRAAAVAAMLVVAVGASVIVWRAMQSDQGSIPSERGGGSMTMEVEPPNGVVLDEPPERLAWSAVENAESYQVVLYDFESTPIWESSPVTSPAVSLPEAVREGLPRGQPYYWRVVVTSGIERRQSQVFQFTLSTNTHE